MKEIKAIILENGNFFKVSVTTTTPSGTLLTVTKIDHKLGKYYVYSDDGLVLTIEAPRNVIVEYFL